MLIASAANKTSIKKAKAIKKLKKKHIIETSKKDLRCAIIDLGTNSVRFDVYSFIKKKVIRFHREKRMIRLGDGVFETGKMSKPAMDRCIKALKDFKEMSDDLAVNKVIAFATSAVRCANNSNAFIKRVRKETGLELEVITGIQESDYIARGIFANLKLPNERIALVDIGGGSTEVTISQGTQIIKQFSFELGANRLQQLFVKDLDLKGSDKAREADLELRRFIRKQLKPLFGVVKTQPVNFVIGSSGTIRNLSRILNKMGHQSQPCRRQDLAGLVAELRTLSQLEIAQLPGVEKGRIDLLLAGALLFEEVLYFVRAKNFYSTSLSLRDGILQYLLDEMS